MTGKQFMNSLPSGHGTLFKRRPCDQAFGAVLLRHPTSQAPGGRGVKNKASFGS